MLRGINVGGNRRVPMAELRALLTGSGYEDVATYVQSGNIVLSADVATTELESSVSALISERFGFDVPVVGRTASELADVLALDPLGEVVTDPKRYQVSFLAAPVADEVRARLQVAVAEPEQLAFAGREIYAWHPDGVARSKLWNALAGTGLGVVSTARNWRTVTTLGQMASSTSG